MRRLPALIISLVLLVAASAQAATFTVNSTVDAVDATPGDGVCETAPGGGVCTLRAAIQESNAWPGADSITVPSGTYTLSIAGTNEDAAATGDLDITGDLTITGASEATTIIDGGGLDRVFHIIGSTATVQIAGVTIQHGNCLECFGGGIANVGALTVTNATVSGNASSYSGGGIQNSGTLTLTDVTVNGNTVSPGCSGNNTGGGIRNSGTLTLTDVTVSGNSAMGGGGIDSYNGTLTLTDVTVSSNTAVTIVCGMYWTNSYGGGISLAAGTATLTNVTVSGNVASARGGGIECTGTATLNNVTVSGNGANRGGGIYNAGALTLTNATISANTARGGGGVFTEAGATTLQNTIVTNNIADEDLTEYSNCMSHWGGRFTSAGHNLSSDTSCGLTGPGDLQGIDSLLGPLADNGGSTLTHALSDASPAIDAGSSDCPAPATDQRGVARPVDGNGDGQAICDIGAYEFVPGTLLIRTILPNKGGNVGALSLMIRGGPFAAGATAKLIRAGQPNIVADPANVGQNGFTLAATFNLTSATPGTYDVVVTNPDGASATLPGGFTVEEGGTPQLWVDIIGRDMIRVGREQAYTILYGNRGNVNIYDVLLYLRVPKEVSYSVQGLLNLNLQPPPVSDQAGVELGTEILIPVWIYAVPAGSTGRLTLRIRTTTSSLQGFHIAAEIVGPPPTDFSRTGDLALTPLYLDLLEQELLKTVFGPSPGSTFQTAQSQHSVTNVNAIDDCPTVECQQQELVRQLREVRQPVLDGARRLTQEAIGSPVQYGVRFGLDFIIAGLCGIALAGGVTSPLAPILCGTALAIQVADGLYTASHILDVGKDLQRMQQEASRTITPVGSLDPNDKVGATGAGDLRHLSGEEPLRYAVFFENIETATAPAQEVVITDQLDATKMDLTTCSLGPIAFGNKQVIPPPGLCDLTTNVDLRPDKNLIVKIETSLNSNTGLLTWRLTSIDPDTGQLPDNPLVGFLPPNVNPPEGDGSVLFTIMSKAGLPSGTQVQNQASIVFDMNAPIATPTWFNTLDNDKPSSHVFSLAASQPATFSVQWAGSDVGSGIRDYSIYVTENGGPYAVWLSNSLETSAMFTGSPGKRYAFYSIARDQAGNLEEAPTVADASTQVEADTTPPTTTATPSPAPNVNGWHNTPVTVTLTAVDNPGGSSVKELSVTLSGASSGSNTVAGSSTTVTITAEGSTTLTYFARDHAGNQEAPQTLTVQLDTTPPTLAGLPVPGCTLWPPNHQLVRVATITATDTRSGLAPGALQVTGISNEPDSGLGNGDQAPDIVISGGSVQLRAERAGTGTGRLYTLAAAVTDLAGNRAQATSTCTVPHDQGKK